MDFVAGVDTHKDSHTIVFLNERGQSVKTLTISATDEGYANALQAAADLGNVRWGLESTGCYGNALAKFLCEHEAEVFEVPGSYTKRHRRRSSRTGKSDALDAQAIAEAVLREADRLPRFSSSPEREAMRLRYEQRDRLVKQRTEAINRLRSAALRLNLRDFPSDLTTEIGLSYVERTLKNVHITDDAIHALVDELRYATEDIRNLNARIRSIEKLLDPLVRRAAPELLEVRGVSTVVAAGLIGNAGDLANCRNANAFAMRSGTAPVSCSSGRYSAVRVNTGGNRQLNRLLHIIALNQIRTPDHRGKVYYDRKRAEGKSAKAALRCLKRQLSDLVFSLLRSAAQPEANTAPVRLAA
jgi:transposase